MDVTQVVPVSVVATQSLLKVPEISELPSSELERAGGCPDYFQGGSQGAFSALFLMFPSISGEARCSFGPERNSVIFP